MALSEKAQARKQIVEQWVIESFHSDTYRTLHEHGGATKGYLLRLRLFMMGGQVQIPEDTNTGLHILDDDSNWRIFQREMKITLQEFYEYAEVSRVFQADGEIKDGWAALMFSHSDSMEQHFHRTRIYRENGRTLYRPEQVDFPDFGFYPWDVVLDLLAFTGGESQLSDDKSISEMRLTINGVEGTFPFNRGSTDFYYNNLAPVEGTVTLAVVPTDQFARVTGDMEAEVSPSSNQARFSFTVIAEDDTTRDYTLLVA